MGLSQPVPVLQEAHPGAECPALTPRQGEGREEPSPVQQWRIAADQSRVTGIAGERRGPERCQTPPPTDGVGLGRGVHHFSLMEHHQLSSVRHLMERTSIPLGAPATRGDGSLHTNVPELFPPAWAGLELPAPGAAGMQGRREQSRGNTAGRDRQGWGTRAESPKQHEVVGPCPSLVVSVFKPKTSSGVVTLQD